MVKGRKMKEPYGASYLGGAWIFKNVPGVVMAVF